MKKSTKPRTADTITVGTSVARDGYGARTREGRLKELLADGERKVPSALEIAHLAAMLAQGRPGPDVADPFKAREARMRLVREAFELWRCSLSCRREQIASNAKLWLGRESEEAEEKDLPKPGRFPVLLRKFLRLAMPQKTVGERMKAYRDYVRYILEIWEDIYATKDGTPIGVVSLDDIEREIVKRQRDGFLAAEYGTELRSLKLFLDDERSSRGKKAARVRWPNKPPKFPVLLSDFLHLALPKKTEEDCMKVFHDYVRSTVGVCAKVYAEPGEATGFVSLDDIEGAIVKRKRDGFSEAEYGTELRSLRRFERASRGTKLALLRWAKEKEIEEKEKKEKKSLAPGG